MKDSIHVVKILGLDIGYGLSSTFVKEVLELRTVTALRGISFCVYQPHIKSKLTYNDKPHVNFIIYMKEAETSSADGGWLVR